MKISLRWMATAGGFLFLLAFLSSFAVMNHLKVFQGDNAQAGLTGESQEDIEIIDISEGSGVTPGEQAEKFGRGFGEANQRHRQLRRTDSFEYRQLRDTDSF
jgi:hypothetical protein